MARQIYVSIFMLAVTTALALAQTVNKDAADKDRQRLIGTWSLLSTEERLPDGSKRPYQDVGPEGKGYLIYTADGHMCAAGMNPHRGAWHDVNKPTNAEKLRATEGFFGYCGRYEVDSAHQVIYHYPEVAQDPNLVGTKQRRPYKFDGDTITYSDNDNTPGVDGYTIRWKKMK